MGLNVLHLLPMLMHELIEAVPGRMTSRDTLFQSLEQLIRLVELNRGLELIGIKEETDIRGV